MKILHIVAGDLNGGAARGAYWLHGELRELGVNSKILTNSKTSFGDGSIVSINLTSKDKLKNFIRSQLDTILIKFYRKRKKTVFSSGLIGFDFTRTKEYIEADIIHLHWINGGFVNIKHLKNINKPIVWTIRDMWPMTGGCHYTMGCDSFVSNCGSCEQLGSNSNFDISRFILSRKKKYLPKHLKVVGISNWLADEAKNSSVFKEMEVSMIQNNINVKDFLVVNKNEARKILGIDTYKKIILVGAQNPKDYYKGFQHYLEAIKFLDSKKYFLCFFGRLDDSSINDLGFEYKNLGFLYDTISLRLLYSASDVFVAPSTQEAFGKTLVEAMNCETPVVCFDATGPKDIVTHKLDGYKAKPFESEDLANGIEWVLNNEHYDKLCKNAREKVLKEFDSAVVAKKYIELYEEILKKG